MLNRVQLIGRLGRDPEVKTMQNGNKVCNLSIAITEKWKDKATGEKKERTEWARCVSFNDRITNFAEGYAKKGALVYFEGAMQTRKYQDANGAEKYTTEVVAQQFNGEFKILSDAKGEGGAQNAPAAKPELDDDLPFLSGAP